MHLQTTWSRKNNLTYVGQIARDIIELTCDHLLEEVEDYSNNAVIHKLIKYSV